MRFGGVLGLFALVGLGLTASACSTRGGAIPYDVGNFRAPDAPVSLASGDNYKLAPLDTITVTVFQVEDLSKDYPIDYTGNFTMPLLGQVNAMGLSTVELAKKLEAQLSQKYLRNPNVSVAIKESASRVVTVDGAVREPGVFAAARPLTLMQTVALAKGVSETANPRRVAIFRMVDGRRMAAAFDLTDIRRGKQQDPTVYAGDTVVVDGSGIRQAQKDIFATVPLLPIFMAL